MTKLGSLSLWAGALLTALLLGSCTTPFDSTRVVPVRGSLGEEIYRVVCQRMASSELPNDVSGIETRELCAGRTGPESAPTPRLAALAARRDRLVRALDRTLPADLEDDLDSFMLKLVPFYDPPDELLPQQTRAVANLLSRILDDPAALDAMARVSSREGYRPLRLALGVTRPLLAYPELPSFITKALSTIEASGSAGAEWEDLVRAVALEMASAEPEAADAGPGTLQVARDLFFTQDSAFGSGAAHFVALRDDRGLVLPTGPRVAAPFVDLDADGYADVDLRGRFIDASGTILATPTPFALLGETATRRDPAGRALRADGSPLYAYLDVNQTLLGGITREASPWLHADTPVALDVAYGLPALLGPDSTRSEHFGAFTHTYPSYDLSQSPLLDLTHAVGMTLAQPSTSDLLALLDTELRDHPEDVAASIDAGLLGDALGDAHPEAVLPADSEFWDDFLQVGQYIAQEPGMLEALLRAFADPRTARLGQIYAEMMRHRDIVDYDHSNMNRVLTDQDWTDPVDRTRPDVAGNRSLFLRTVAIIHDLNHARICNKEGARLVMSLPIIGDVTVPFLSYHECELLEIDDVAKEYARAIIGRSHIVLKSALLNEILRLGGLVGLGADQVLESQSGITGLTTHPTPQALNRLVFAPRTPFLTSLIDPPRTRDGQVVETRHDPVIFAWERKFRFCGEELVTPGAPCTAGVTAQEVTFYEAMAPLIRAFDDYDRGTEGRYLFSELISALNLHFPSHDSDWTQERDSSAPAFAHQDGVVRYEPILSALFAGCLDDASGRCRPDHVGQLLTRTAQLLRSLESIEVRPGVDGLSVMASATEELLDPTKNPGLADRRGATHTRTNGGSRSPNITPIYLLLDSLSGMDRAWAAAPDRHTRWLSARSAMVDQMLTATHVSGSYRFQNARMLAALRILLPFLEQRIAAHRDARDLEAWSANLDDRLEASLGSAVGSASFRFLDAIQRDPEAKDALSNLASYLVDEAASNDNFRTSLVAGADLMQVLGDDVDMVPLLHALAPGLATGTDEAVAGGPAPEVRGAALDRTLDLLRAVDRVDEHHTLSRVLQNLVSLPDDSSEETPLEVMIDVAAEVNRAEPGLSGPLSAEDGADVLGVTHDFFTSEDRGLERIYRVIQNRELAP